MKEKTPCCSNCKTNDFVVLEKQGTQASTVIGGMAGASAAYLALSKPASLAGIALAVLAGLLTGAATGSSVGEHIDGNVRMTYRCNQCGKKFKG